MNDCIQPLDLSRDHIPSSSNQQQTSFGGFGVLSGLVHGGIDVLESIGKKTFETITVREEVSNQDRFPPYAVKNILVHSKGI